MFVSLILSYLDRRPAFRWSPALDLRDNAIRSLLLPTTHS